MIGRIKPLLGYFPLHTSLRMTIVGNKNFKGKMDVHDSILSTIPIDKD